MVLLGILKNNSHFSNSFSFSLQPKTGTGAKSVSLSPVYRNVLVRHSITEEAGILFGPAGKKQAHDGRSDTFK